MFLPVDVGATELDASTSDDVGATELDTFAKIEDIFHKIKSCHCPFHMTIIM